MKLVSYNVNGIRAAMNKGLVDWLGEHQYDVVCIQETKAQPDQVDEGPFEEMGYQSFWHSAEKKGYSGVAIYTKKEPDQVISGCGLEKYDSEGRIMRADFGDLTLLNCYFPSGTTGDIRQAIKMEFLDDFFQWAHELKKERPNLLITGDYNIAHTEMDIHNPKSNQKTSGFLPEERAWMTKWFDSGFTDAFRFKHPDKEEYSWWSYRAGARGKNKGWRIDYWSVADEIKGKIKAAGHHNEAMHSDHCPVFLEIGV